MISLDANILLYGYCPGSPYHGAARKFVESLAAREDVAVSEFVLSEFYLHLRNPAVLEEPLTSRQAVDVIEHYRNHPRWKTLGFPPGSRKLHDELWQRAATKSFGCRRIYDARIALCLRAFGVTDFATLNLKDFQSFGFRRVWNPLTG